jgi:hypothetical protein
MKHGLVALALLAAALLVTGCGDSDGSGSGGTADYGAADTSVASAAFEDTFGEPPDACEAGYGVWETGLDFEEHDVTYCYSGEIVGGKPFNTGCYLTESGQDVTVAYRNVNGTDTC